MNKTLCVKKEGQVCTTIIINYFFLPVSFAFPSSSSPIPHRNGGKMDSCVVEGHFFFLFTIS
ncbi:unnamed protein product [Meloidogyne enterolobii]|uniref:Uncharacterized protein n=1 Tax=Meloidogyne enterolobii TaxID=390850 RepID=A0ACB0YWE5_MELEN